MEELIEIVSDEEIEASFTGDALSMYIKEAFKFKVLSADENKELGRRARNGDSAAYEKLINHNLRLVINLAYKYRDRISNMQLLDLIQEGNLGLMRAVETYDPELGAFSTYAIPWIKQKMNRGIQDKEDTIRKPVHIKELIPKYVRLVQQNKYITDEELTKQLGIGYETLESIRKGFEATTTSMNRTVDDDAETELGDFIPSYDHGYDDILESMSAFTLFVAVKEVLNDCLYYIVYKRILSGEKTSLEDLGTELGLTRERVRQLEEKALRKVKPLMQSETKMQMVLKTVQDREQVRLELLNTEPKTPSKIIKFIYLKRYLDSKQITMLQYMYFSKYKINKKQLAYVFKMDDVTFKQFYAKLMKDIESALADKEKYLRFKNGMIKTYGTTIFDVDILGDVKYVDYEELKERYESLGIDGILEYAKMADYAITHDEVKLLERYFYVPERKYHYMNLLLRDLNLAVFGYKERYTNVPKSKLLKVYNKNLDDYSEEQRLFLECYFFKIRDKKEFKTTYKDSSLYYRYYYLIDRLERTYYNIYRYLDNNFTKKEYIKFKKKYKGRLSDERIELLDLFYGVNGDAMSIPEIAEMYNMDYIKMHDKISDAREAAILINTGVSQKLEINKKLYIPFIKKQCYVFTPETREVLRLYLVENLSHGEIGSRLGLSNYRVSNIVTDGIRKIDNYRFGLSEYYDIDRRTLKDVFEYYNGSFSKEEQEVLKKKFLEFMENSDIASSIGITLKTVNEYVGHFNRLYYSYRIKDVNLTTNDILDELNRHVSESLLSEFHKEFVAFYFGISCKYNKEGIKLSQDELKYKYNLNKNAYYRATQIVSNELKGRKIGIRRVPNLFIDRMELDRLLDDPHLPISDKERDIISYLFELKGFPYKTLDELPEIFGDNKGSIYRRYQRSIVSIFKYLNNEIDGKLSYEVDILPNMKYFSYSDRNIINAYFKDGMTVEVLAKKYNVNFEKMFSVIERIRININDILNNPNCKKFDFDYYMKVRHNDDLPFFGNTEVAIQIFDLFYGMTDELRISIPEIKKRLGLEVEITTINKTANNFMLSICKYQEGIRAAKHFSYDDIVDYYERHKDTMSSYYKQFYIRYFEKVKRQNRLNGVIPGVSYVILYDLLVEKNPDVYTFDNLDRDTVLKLIKQHGKNLSGAVRKELMALYEIRTREFMSGKEINHVFRIFNNIDTKLREKGIKIHTLKKD